MDVLVIDAQGGGIGRQIIMALKKELPEIEISAIGTNSTATAVMKKAGAAYAATGENAVIVSSARARVIVGPIGIVLADSMMGEITPRMAAAIGSSTADKVLIPMNRCGTLVAGVGNYSISDLVNQAAEEVKKLFK